MIFLGLDAATKSATISRYCEDHGVAKVLVLSPVKFRTRMTQPHEYVEWSTITLYRVFYRLMQEVNAATLVIVDECLRVQNRHDLTYNCIRNFLNQTPHVLVFQYLPIIDSWDDFAVLFDFATRSRWKREQIGHTQIKEVNLRVVPVPLELREDDVATDAGTRAAYGREKRALVDNIGLRDPHNIPRNLYLMSGKAKLAHVAAGRSYVGRNDRFKVGLVTFKKDSYPSPPYTVFEFCHNVVDFIDFLSLSRQTRVDVLVADLKVDRWYFRRYLEWLGRLRDAYAMLGAAS